MSQYIKRVIGRPKSETNFPFQISQSGNKFYVSSGRCYSTFSYSNDSLIPIENFYSPLPQEEISPNEIQDYYVYIDFTILSNLQISGAEIKMSKVGDMVSNQSDWTDYPNQYKIRPFDIKNSQGEVIQIIDGKKQEKSYLLLGKVWADYPEADPYKITTITGVGENGNIQNYYLTQYNNNDIIMMMSQVSGVPIVFPLPYVGGPYWKT